MAMSFQRLVSAVGLASLLVRGTFSRRLTKWVMLQKRNKMQAAESRALMVLTIRAT